MKDQRPSTVFRDKEAIFLGNRTKIAKHTVYNKKRNFRFYIYELPLNLNENLTKCNYHQPFMCTDFNDNGMGLEMFKTGENGGLSIRNSSQFSLEVIIHNKLKTNRLRTWNPDEADVFYIPAYFALLFLCNENETEPMMKETSTLRKLLSESSYFARGKLHISTLSFLYLWMRPDLFLTNKIIRRITFITLESLHPKYGKPIPSEIVSPYPSYGHFLPSRERVLVTIPISSRNIFILLPVGKRYICKDREVLKQQFDTNTDLPYNKFMEKKRNQTFKRILFYTNECSHNSTRDIVPWMQNSVFCLHPTGATETRKSFYDSMLCGCIPVIMTHYGNPYPFKQYIEYDKFSIHIPFTQFVSNNISIYDILSKIPMSKVDNLQLNLKRLTQYMQYSIPDGKTTDENDAIRMIFMELSDRFKLPYDKKSITI